MTMDTQNDTTTQERDEQAAASALSASTGSGGWNVGEPPKDGKGYVACGRVTWADESGGGSSPFVSEIYWDSKIEMWCHRRDEEVGMTVARFNDERVHVDNWIPLPNDGKVSE